MIYRNVSDAKAELSKLIEEALSGKEVVLGKAGKPLIRLSLYQAPTKKRKPGRLEGQFKLDDKFNDFDPELEALFSSDTDPSE